MNTLILLVCVFIMKFAFCIGLFDIKWQKKQKLQ